MDVHTPTGGGLRVAPHHGVVSGERAGRVIRGAQHRQLTAPAEVHERAHLEDLVGSEDVGAHAERSVQRGLLAFDLQRVLRVADIELPLVREQDVEVELLRQPAVLGEAGGVERHRLRGVVVGPEDLRVATAPAAPDVGALDHRDVADPVFGGEVVRERQPVHASAHDDDVVRASQLALREVDTSPEEPGHVREPASSMRRFK